MSFLLTWPLDTLAAYDSIDFPPNGFLLWYWLYFQLTAKAKASHVQSAPPSCSGKDTALPFGASILTGVRKRSDDVLARVRRQSNYVFALPPCTGRDVITLPPLWFCQGSCCSSACFRQGCCSESWFHWGQCSISRLCRGCRSAYWLYWGWCSAPKVISLPPGFTKVITPHPDSTKDDSPPPDFAKVGCISDSCHFLFFDWCLCLNYEYGYAFVNAVCLFSDLAKIFDDDGWSVLNKSHADLTRLCPASPPLHHTLQIESNICKMSNL